MDDVVCADEANDADDAGDGHKMDITPPQHDAPTRESPSPPSLQDPKHLPTPTPPSPPPINQEDGQSQRVSGGGKVEVTPA